MTQRLLLAGIVSVAAALLAPAPRSFANPSRRRESCTANHPHLL